MAYEPTRFQFVQVITDDWAELSVDLDDHGIEHLIMPMSIDSKMPHIVMVVVCVPDALALLEALPKIESSTWHSTEPRDLYKAT